MIITYKYEHFVQFTVDMLDDFVRKGINIAFRGLGRSTRFCNPEFVKFGQFSNDVIVRKIGESPKIVIIL